MFGDTDVWLEVKSVKSLKFWQAVASEYVGTVILMYAQSTLPLNMGVGASDIVRSGLGMGFVVFGLITALGPIGGAHLNPAVTISMLWEGRISILKSIFYVIAQVLGALCGTGIVYLVTPMVKHETLAATLIHPKASIAQGLAVEFCVAFILLLVIWGTIDTRLTNPVVLPGLPVGMIVTVDILSSGFHTGAGLNPARSFAPAVVVGDPALWANHWVYWVGPITGGLFATCVYHWILTARPETIGRGTKTSTSGPANECCRELMAQLSELLRKHERSVENRAVTIQNHTAVHSSSSSESGCASASDDVEEKL